jgi:hypothetical protein
MKVDILFLVFKDWRQEKAENNKYINFTCVKNICTDLFGIFAQ